MARPKEIRIVATGLQIDPGDLATVKGSMRQAENVMVRRRGLLQLRPGFGKAPTAEVADTAKTTYRPVAIFPFGGDLVIVSFSPTATPGWRTDIASVGTALTGGDGGAPPRFGWADPMGAIMRESLYLTGYEGLIKVPTPTATAFDPVGARSYETSVGIFPAATAAPTWLGVGENVAYRFVWVRVDANGYERRSAPSGRIEATNALGTARSVIVTLVAIPPELEAGDTFECYRTRSTSGTPLEEYFLSFTHTLTAAEITAGILTGLPDLIPNDNLGAALYTNPGEQTIAKANALPPISHDLEVFQGCLWLGNLIRPHRLRMDIVDASGVAAGAKNLTGLQRRDITATYAIGSNVLTGVALADFDGLVTGMAIAAVPDGYETAGTLPAGTVITALNSGAGTITVSQNATANAPAQATQAADYIQVDTVRFYCDSGTAVTGPYAYRLFEVSSDADATTRAIVTAQSFASVVNLYESTNGYPLGVEVIATGGEGANRSGFLMVESTSAQTPISVRSTRPYAFEPALGEGTGIGLTTQEKQPHAIAYSREDLPEAVPEGNWIPLGAERFRVLRMVRLRDALIVFKEDGIFRVTGYPPDAWNVTTLDGSVRLLEPSALCVLGNAIYAWTDRGVVRVTEVGVELISEPAIGAALEKLQRDFPIGLDGETFGIFMEAHPRLGLVILSTPLEPGASTIEGEQIWAYDVGLGTWARWAIKARCAAYDPARDALYLGRGDDEVDVWEIRRERTAGDDTDARDGEHSGTTLSITGITVSINKSEVPNWLPEEEDYVLAGGLYGKITGVSDNGTSWGILVDRSDLPQGSSVPIVGLETIRAVIEWNPVFPMSPALEASWDELCLHLEEISAAIDPGASWAWSIGGTSENLSSPATVEADLKDYFSGPFERSRPLPVGLGLELCDASRFYAYIRIAVVDLRWKVSAISITYTPTTGAIGRRG